LRVPSREGWRGAEAERPDVHGPEGPMRGGSGCPPWLGGIGEQASCPHRDQPRPRLPVPDLHYGRGLGHRVLRAGARSGEFRLRDRHPPGRVPGQATMKNRPAARICPALPASATVSRPIRVQWSGTDRMAGLAYAGKPTPPLDTLEGFGCRANRNNAGYDEGDIPPAGSGIGRDPSRKRFQGRKTL
jgi:hypothetical protein